ncbi:MAG: 50S ribosomal protein L3 N(5)-glutamine methyltransferase [Gammaproteobacteria bacterium]
MTHSFSVRELIQRTEKQFNQADLYYGHGTDNALDEAFYLVMIAAGLEFDCDEEALDKPLLDNIIEHIENLVEKRINQRVPVAYLVNQAWFAGHKFYVDERVLIPRSPFAELITSQFMPWISYSQVKTILDIGTGGACIPIACAYEFSETVIDAVDIDDDAIDVANKNVALHELQERVHVIKSNLFEQLKGKKYDLIISNPPYVGHDEMQSLPEEYLHEPRHALEADDNGLELVGQILKQASEHLNEGGILAVEVGNSKEALIEQYPNLPFIWLEFENGGDGVFVLNKADLV